MEQIGTKCFFLPNLQFETLGLAPSGTRSLLPLWLRCSWWLFLMLLFPREPPGGWLMPFPVWCWPLAVLSTLPWTPWARLRLSTDKSAVDLSESCWSSWRHCVLLSLSRLLLVSCRRLLGCWVDSSVPQVAWALISGLGGPALVCRGAGVPRHTTSSSWLSPLTSTGEERISWGFEHLFVALCGSLDTVGQTAALVCPGPTGDLTFLVSFGDLICCFSFCLWASHTSSGSSSGARVRGRLTCWLWTSPSDGGLSDLRSESNCVVPPWVSAGARKRPAASFSSATDTWWPGILEERLFLAASLRFWPCRCNVLFLTWMAAVSPRWGAPWTKNDNSNESNMWRDLRFTRRTPKSKMVVMVTRINI